MFALENRTIDRYTDEMLKVELDANEIKDILAEKRKSAYEYFEKIFLVGENE